MNVSIPLVSVWARIYRYKYLKKENLDSTVLAPSIVETLNPENKSTLKRKKKRIQSAALLRKSTATDATNTLWGIWMQQQLTQAGLTDAEVKLPGFLRQI